MSKWRKRVSFLLMLSMLLCMFIVPSFAGNSNISFNLGNTGKRFNVDVNSANNKTTSASQGSGWVFNLSNITFYNCNNLSSSLGMAFLPLVYRSAGGDGPGYYNGGGTYYWTKYEGRFTHYYSSGYGAVGTYYLGARLDDILTGTGRASGIWNADTI